MAFDGNGTFNRLFSWAADKLAAINITASRMDSEDSGFAAGLSLCVTRDGQGKMSADFTPATDNNLNLGTQSFRWASFNGTPASLVLPGKAIKAVGTARLNTTTGANDPDLTFVIAGSGTYAYEIYLNFWGSVISTQGFKHNINFSGTFTAGSSNYNQLTTGLLPTINSVASGANSGLAGLADMGSTSQGTAMMLMRGVLVATSAGTLSFAWCQNSSNANATNVGPGAFMLVSQLA